MSKKYVRKPVMVEAIQWTGSNKKEIELFVGHSVFEEVSGSFIVVSMCRDIIVSFGDWIVKEGTDIYPVSDYIFKSTYEVVKND